MFTFRDLENVSTFYNTKNRTNFFSDSNQDAFLKMKFSLKKTLISPKFLDISLLRPKMNKYTSKEFKICPVFVKKTKLLN